MFDPNIVQNDFFYQTGGSKKMEWKEYNWTKEEVKP
jgi:hypothetical protein